MPRTKPEPQPEMPLRAEPADALDLFSVALAKATPPGQPIAPGKYVLRGVATLAVDVWIEKREPTEAQKPLPSEKILAIALGLACTEPEQLRALIKRAAKKVLEAGERTVDLGQVGFEMLGLRTQLQEQLGKQPREGATTVKGDVRIVGFEPAVQSAAPPAKRAA